MVHKLLASRRWIALASVFVLSALAFAGTQAYSQAVASGPDDPKASLSADRTSVREPIPTYATLYGATFTVSLSPVPSTAVTVAYRVDSSAELVPLASADDIRLYSSGGTAVQGMSGTVTLTPPATEAELAGLTSLEGTFVIRPIGDRVIESYPEERFRVSLVDGTGYDLSKTAPSSVDITINEGVCDRTREVCEAVVAQASLHRTDLTGAPSSDCYRIVKADLDLITTLDVSGYGRMFNNVRAYDFRDLDNLTTIDFSRNEIRGLPNNFFTGATGLVSADFSGNPETFVLTGDLVGQGFVDGVPGAFVVRVPEGVPFDTKFMLSAAVADPNFPVSMFVDGEAVDDVTIPRGATGSPTVTVKSNGESPFSMAIIELTGANFVDPLLGDNGVTAFTVRSAGLAAAYDDNHLDVRISGTVPIRPSMPPVLSVSVDGSQIMEDDPHSKVTVTLSLDRVIGDTDPTARGRIFLTNLEGNPSAVNGYDYRISNDDGVYDNALIPFAFSSGDRVQTFDITPISDDELEPMLEYLVVAIWVGGEGYTLENADVAIPVSVNEGICDRTSAVRSAIVALMPQGDQGNDCYDSVITPEYLQGLVGTLDVNGATGLQSFDLQHLSGVRGLDLRDSSKIDHLPAGLFDGITLTTLRTSPIDRGLKWSARLRQTRVQDGFCFMDFEADVGFPFKHLIVYEVDSVVEEGLPGERYNQPGVLHIEDFLHFDDAETVAAQVVSVYNQGQFLYPEKKITFVEHPRELCSDEPRTAASQALRGASEWPTVSVNSSSSSAARNRHGGGTEATPHDTLHVDLDSAVEWDIHVPFWVTTLSADADLGEQLVGFSWATLPAGHTRATMNLDLDVLRTYTSNIPSNVTYQLSPPVPTLAGYSLSKNCTSATKEDGNVTDICGRSLTGDGGATTRD